jgi:hypothetical protein
LRSRKKKPPDSSAKRALTVRQPWAWAIIHAGKDIENRSWSNRYVIGTIAVHAGVGMDSLDELPRGVRRPKAPELVRGAIIGVVDVGRVVKRHHSKWFRGPLGWVLENPRAIAEPIRCKGRLGLWILSPRVRALIDERIKRRRPRLR